MPPWPRMLSMRYLPAISSPTMGSPVPSAGIPSMLTPVDCSNATLRVARALRSGRSHLLESAVLLPSLHTAGLRPYFLLARDLPSSCAPARTAPEADVGCAPMTYETRLRTVGRHLLSGVMIMMGILHFTNADSFASIMPAYLPWHVPLV